MCIGRGIISTLLALVVGGAPVVAIAAPCCCTAPVEQRPACCVDDVPTAPQPVHECCAKREVAAAPPIEQIVPGCCCVKAVPPAVPNDRTPVLTVFGDPTLPALPCTAALMSTETPWLSMLSIPGLQFPDEPPVSVRLCVWLK